MINGEPLSAMTQSVFGGNKSLYLNQQSPTTRLTLEQQYQNLAQSMLPNQNQQQSHQSSPYSDYRKAYGDCSKILREKITNDLRFQEIYNTCDLFVKETLYAEVIPVIINNSQEGRILFERLYSTFKALEDDYAQKDIQKEKMFDTLMQDEVVLRRLQELQSAPQQSQASHPTQTPLSQQTPQQAPIPPQSIPKQTNQPPPQKQNNYNKNNSQQKPQSSGGVD